MTTTPFMETVPIRVRIALTAAPSAAVLVAAADPPAGGHRGGLGDPDQLQREVAVRCLPVDGELWRDVGHGWPPGDVGNQGILPDAGSGGGATMVR